MGVTGLLVTGVPLSEWLIFAGLGISGLILGASAAVVLLSPSFFVKFGMDGGVLGLEGGSNGNESLINSGGPGINGFSSR